jgi:hypothetical protein
MNMYNVGQVASMTAGSRGALLYGFNITGVVEQPVVAFAFGTKDEADTAHKAMQMIMAKAIVVAPYPSRGK